MFSEKYLFSICVSILRQYPGTEKNLGEVFQSGVLSFLSEGGGTIYSIGFFVHTILTDRYIHSKELRLVSFENSSSLEYGIKKTF